MNTDDRPESPQTAGGPRTLLRAGPLTLEYGDGAVWRVRWNGKLVLHSVYAAVRGRDWETIAPDIREVDREVEADSFRIVFDAVHLHDDVHFTWRGSIVGLAEGSISFDFDGSARSPFLRSRIGLCLQHPAACAGASCRVEHVDGSASEAALPEFPSSDQPVPPFNSMRALSHVFGELGRVHFRFEGEAFELEDQRNWTDASFKAYSTPTDLPHPLMIPAGTRVQQRVTVSVRPARSAASALPLPEDGEDLASRRPVRISIDNRDEAVRRLPDFGLGLAAHAPAPLAGRAAELVARLRPDWLRVDVRLGRDGWQQRLERAMAEVDLLPGTRIEAALFLSFEHAEVELAALSEWLVARADGFPIGRYLLLPDWEGRVQTRPYAELLGAAASILPERPDGGYAVGTNSDFIFLSRFAPVPEAADAAVFAINPQVHASDDASMVETLPMQGVVVRAARRLVTPVQQVIVSPVTLLPRWNPYAVTPGDPDAAPPADPRQQSLFAAGWTLGSLKYLGEGGADSVTFYETHGDNGVVSVEGGRVSPVWFVFQAAYGAPLDWRGIVPAHSSDPSSVVCLALVDASGLKWRALLANLTAATVPVNGVSGAVRLLDDAGVGAATADPNAFWAATPLTVEGENILLPSYAVAVVDWELAEPATCTESEDPSRRIVASERTGAPPGTACILGRSWNIPGTRLVYGLREAAPVAR